MTRRLCLLVMLLLVVGGRGRLALGATLQEKKLQEATRAYNRGEYGAVVKLLKPLLHPVIRLSSESQVIQAYRLLGIAYIFEKDRLEAEKQFMGILALRPDFRFDPLVDPVAAVELLEELKRRNAEKLKTIRERERLETERRRRDEEARRRREEEARRRAQRPSQIIERTVLQRQFWVSFVPLGAGQIQNGQRRKGFALMGVELGLGAASLATGISAWALWSSYRNDPKRTVDDHDRIRALSIAQLATGAACLATVVYGIIDALVYYGRTTPPVQERRVPLPARLEVAPVVTSDGAGLGLGMRF